MEKPSKGSANVLKLIAIVTMLIDHMGVLIFPEQTWMRWVGRISFPIFAYGIAQGFRYTSHRKKYGLLLLAFALISQVPYMFLNYGAAFNPYQLNVIFMLLYGYILLYLVEKVEKNSMIGLIPLIVILLFLPSVLESYMRAFQGVDFRFSYSTYGLVMILLFYFFAHKPVLLGLSYLALSIISPLYDYLLMGAMAPGFTPLEYLKLIIEHYGLEQAVFRSQFYSIIAVPIITTIRERNLEFTLPKYVSYLFYPVHISILLGIHALL